ncbi:type 1 glutamine amidotransferase [Desulfosarcina cetonica]|uniref:type 1 glutamine amidotransferase n=1 Tax=Desulfosarcina cetonica TaxID=90730 RepID=UPI0006D1B5A6|nr:gamma-glutamyl-gamma-aminobutyrate hydrolase family protein [Desulfosarcina cetonica]
MRAHYFQHVPFEGLGSIAPWLENAGHSITRTQFFKSWVLPDPATIDFLIVMGGPMSVNDENTYPWLAEEKRFIHEIMMSGKPVLGICLGAQLIASAMGSKVYPNPSKEIGWFPIHGTATAGKKTLKFPETITVFHWHGETYDLPTGANRIASSAVCENQAFQVGRNVIGLQFHLETTPASAHEIVRNCQDELQPAEYIQSATTILSASSEQYQAINRQMKDVLSFLTAAKAE